MARSVWKGPFVDASVLQHSFDKRINIWSRRSVIIPQFINQQVYIYNGKTFISLLVTEDMVGHKFGEFAITRKRALHKKKVKKKK
jgi:small subunit ribosomal protein S19|tara:strand:- start:239 stop:493 length:255 start_codon:yes stop_codon:yes gene_type:complete